MIRLRVADVHICVRFSFFAVIAAVNIFSGSNGAGLLLLSISAHEAAHIAAMAAFMIKIRSVEMSGLGIRITSESATARPIEKTAVSLAGPMANLLLAALGALFDSEFAGINLALGLFHVIPVEPLDGALAIKELLKCRMSLRKADRTAFTISLVFLLPLSVIGFLEVLRKPGNFSLLFLCVYLMLYLIMKKDFCL